MHASASVKLREVLHRDRPAPASRNQAPGALLSVWLRSQWEIGHGMLQIERLWLAGVLGAFPQTLWLRASNSTASRLSKCSQVAADSLVLARPDVLVGMVRGRDGMAAK